MRPLLPRRTEPSAAEVNSAALRQIRALLRSVMGSDSTETMALDGQCSPRTIARILKLHNVSIVTLERVLKGRGYRLVISAEKDSATSCLAPP